MQFRKKTKDWRCSPKEEGNGPFDGTSAKIHRSNQIVRVKLLETETQIQNNLYCNDVRCKNASCKKYHACPLEQAWSWSKLNAAWHRTLDGVISCPNHDHADTQMLVCTPAYMSTCMLHMHRTCLRLWFLLTLPGCKHIWHYFGLFSDNWRRACSLVCRFTRWRSSPASEMHCATRARRPGFLQDTALRMLWHSSRHSMFYLRNIAKGRLVENFELRLTVMLSIPTIMSTTSSCQPHHHVNHPSSSSWEVQVAVRERVS